MERSEYLERMHKFARDRWIPIMEDDTLDFLKNLFAGKKFKNILEIGGAIGFSAICFSEFLQEDGHITTIELDEVRADFAKLNIDEVGLSDKITVVNMNAVDYISTLTDSFDFIFIDANKSSNQFYFQKALELTHPGSYIITDNVLFKGLVLSDYNGHKHRTAVRNLRKYINDTLENHKCESKLYEIGDGFIVSIKK